MGSGFRLEFTAATGGGGGDYVFYKDMKASASFEAATL